MFRSSKPVGFGPVRLRPTSTPGTGLVSLLTSFAAVGRSRSAGICSTADNMSDRFPCHASSLMADKTSVRKQMALPNHNQQPSLWFDSISRRFDSTLVAAATILQP